ncbi:MAG: methyltransferase [Anaerolineae bacterium]|nr:methyltransferase [Anaerolineae bacterium]MBC8332850.1 methyltransferase [Anaerolineae bacterium]
MIVLSHYQIQPVLQLRDQTLTVEISPDLGISTIEAELNGQGIYFPTGERLNWDAAAEIAENENGCFLIEGGQAQVIQSFSETFQRVYTLYPTQAAPTMLVSGLPMHRIKDTDPWRDTQAKIRALGHFGGRVLDTTTGLGYTAILAAEQAANITTVELDPAAQKIARQNPWSQSLFGSPKIEQIIGDSNDVIETFSAGQFNAIIHDPPMFSLAGELYSLEFYRQAYRVLKPNGRMFHYIGNPESKSGGRMTSGVVRRLKQAGFRDVQMRPKAFGVLALK